MKKPDYYLKSELDTTRFTPNQWDGLFRAIKKAQIDAVKETIKKCFDEFELFEINGVAVGIDYNSTIKVSEQITKDINTK